jgi:hypothetical protein
VAQIPASTQTSPPHHAIRSVATAQHTHSFANPTFHTPIKIDAEQCIFHENLYNLTLWMSKATQVLVFMRNHPFSIFTQHGVYHECRPASTLALSNLWQKAWLYSTPQRQLALRHLPALPHQGRGSRSTQSTLTNTKRRYFINFS